MRKTMQPFFKALAIAITGASFLALPSLAFAQQTRPRVVVINRVPVIDPFFPYPYPYPANYLDSNYGYVKLDTHLKDAEIYVDGGFADKVKHNKKFALRPGDHDIELRGADGQTIYEQRVAVIVGKTTKLEIAS